MPMALKRYHSLRRKLERDNTTDKFVDTMNAMIEKGYAEPVPHDELDMRGGPVWYLPTFPVISESRPDKMRIT